MEYRPGWFEHLLLRLGVPHFDILKTVEEKEVLYLRRFYFFKRSAFFLTLTGGRYEGLYLHHVMRPDEDQHLHDHPWDFSALIVAGGYQEDIPNLEHGKTWKHGGSLLIRVWGPLSFRSSRAEQLHRISADHFKKTWTIFLAGPKRRVWGFETENGWMPYDEYLLKHEPGRMDSE